ncbi:hypothetical protein STEG23_005123, partial [Scotinomys teguina]
TSKDRASPNKALNDKRGTEGLPDHLPGSTSKEKNSDGDNPFRAKCSKLKYSLNVRQSELIVEIHMACLQDRLAIHSLVCILTNISSSFKSLFIISFALKAPHST